jgi:hypothetical protein
VDNGATEGQVITVDSPTSNPDGYPYAVTIRSPDHAVLCCFEGLNMFAQRATDRDRRPQSRWREDRITFYFTTAKGAKLFVVKAHQLLPADTWFVETPSNA